MLWGTLGAWTERAARAGGGSVLRSVDLDSSPGRIELEGGRLVGEGVVGSVLRGVDGDGQQTEVAICGAEPSREDPRMVWYQIQAWNPVARQWENPCAAAGDVVSPRAMAMAGTWDEAGGHHDEPRRMTFACETGALSKCALWGYAPWASRDGRSLADAHQACTRMVRADYCGNGQSHTSEGTMIDYYDPLGINQRTTVASQGGNPAEASFEAAWTPDGAGCLARTRDGRALESILRECPGRFQPGTADLGNGDRCAVQRPDPGVQAAPLRNWSSRPGARW
ncbi:MAG TPA: ADYC domain-containing protein [Myxococcaceae bacterium]